MRQVLFIHAAGRLEEGSGSLVAYLRDELGAGYDVKAPEMPEPDAPGGPAWLGAVDALLADLPPDGILVGHSLGGSVLIKCIAERQPGLRAAGLVTVAAPFWGEPDWEVDAFRLPEGWPDALGGIGRIVLVHSRDDDVVPPSHMAVYKRHLPRAETRTVADCGHVFDRGGRGALVEEIRRS